MIGVSKSGCNITLYFDTFEFFQTSETIILASILHHSPVVELNFQLLLLSFTSKLHEILGQNDSNMTCQGSLQLFAGNSRKWQTVLVSSLFVLQKGSSQVNLNEFEHNMTLGRFES